MARKSKEEIRALLNAKLERWWNEDAGARKRIDWIWFLYDLWKEGFHYARYDKNTQQILSSPKPDGRPKVTINKIEPTIRAIVNYALRNRPKAEVTPSGLSRDGLKDIVRQNMFLDYLHDHISIREKQRGALEEGLTSGIGWVQVLWDEEADDGKGEISVNEIDKYDLYWQARARDPKESKRFCLAVSRRIADLKEDLLYKGTNWDLVKADNQRSSSTFKERLMRLEMGDDSATSGKDDGSVLLKEWWYYGDKELGEDPKVIYVCATAGGEIIREPEATDLTRMPFFRICPARKKLSMVGKSWVKNLIPLNKRLNSLMSSLAEYNVVMNKVVIFADKGAGVRQFTNQFGVVYEKKRGYSIESASPGSPSAMIIQEIQYILQLFEDIASVHDATMGRIPVGAKSGKALEALQVGDSNNLAEVVENTEIWLEEIYEYVLSLAAKKYQFTREITPTTTTAQREFLKVIGEEAAAAEGQPPDGSVVIHKQNVVDVKISSYLAHTSEGRKEAVKELASILPDLDEQTILEAFDIGPIADVVQRMKDRREQQMADQLAQQAVATKMNQPPQAGPQEAIAIIRSILSGQAPELPANAGPEFVAYFDRFLQSPEAAKLDEPMRALIQKIRDQVAATGNSRASQPMTNGQGPKTAVPVGGSSPRNIPSSPSPS